MRITTRQKGQNLTLKCLPISIGNQTVNKVDNHKVLGVTTDCSLSWASLVTAFCKSASKKIYQLSIIKHFLDLHARKKKKKCTYSIHRRLRIDTVGLSKCKYSQTLVNLHKRVLKAILLKTTTLTISDYNFLSVLSLKERLNYNKGVLIHKIMSGKVPPSLMSNFSRNQSRHSGKLNIPILTDLFKSSLEYSGSVLWNSLPDSLRSSTDTFKSRYMSYFMRWLFGIAC